MSKLLDEMLLRSFVEAARYGSFTQAASRLGRTQVALTLKIQRLEEIVGQALFTRTTRGVTLTAAGTDFMPYAERMLALGHEAQQHMQLRLNDTLSRPRKIAMIEDLSNIGILEQGLSSIAPGFDSLVLDFNFQPSTSAKEAYQSGAVDLFIGDRLPPLFTEQEPMASITVPLAWVAAPNFDFTARPLPLAVYDAPCIWRERAMDTLHATGITTKIAVESRSISGILSAVRSGTAIAALLPSSVQDGLLVLNHSAAHLPPPPAVEIALYQSPQALNDPVMMAFSDVLWQKVSGLAA